MDSKADFCTYHELQEYCNYPEVSKIKKIVNLELDETSLISSICSSSILGSLNSAVSDPASQPNLFYERKVSRSLYNYHKSSQTEESDASWTCIEEDEESVWSSELQVESESTVGSSTCDVSLLLEEDNILSVPYFQHMTDPKGWIKYATDLDPWNEKYYQPIKDSSVLCHGGILTHQLIAACSLNIDQLPDSKSFVFTRLHINKQGLEDISTLAEYKYFQYVDMSWNFVLNLKALNNLDYLMYLNASHNKLTTVLDIRPPCFLTHVNLSCNEIREIGEDLSKFWSLCYIDLSYNLIDKIEGLHNLRFLKYLNLSHNHIRKIENLDSYNLTELYLEHNNIAECDTSGTGLHVLKEIKTLKLAHNKLTCLVPFEALYSLKKLDISNNQITELYELSMLTSSKNLHDLNIAENPVCSITSCRAFVIFRFPSLTVLSSVPVSCSERVASKMLFGPDMLNSIQHVRAKTELWNQLAVREVGCDTVPSSTLPVPLVVLVGTFANNKEEIAYELAYKFPNQVYRCKKYTTMPSQNAYNPNNLISVSMDEFNLMLKKGEFLVQYQEIGNSFGISRDELCKLILEGKIGVIDAPLEAALVLKLSGLRPLIVLCVTNDIESYAERLRSLYMTLELFTNKDQLPYKTEESKKTSILKNETVLHDIKCLCQNKTHGLKSVDCRNLIGELNFSNEDNISNTSKESYTLKKTKSKSVTWNLREEVNEFYEESACLSFSEEISLLESGESSYASNDAEKNSSQSDSISFEFQQDLGSFNTNLFHQIQSKESQDTANSSGSEVTITRLNPSRLSDNTNTVNLLLDEGSGSKQSAEEASFEWKWSFDPSVSIVDPTPDQNYLNMLQGREKFVRDTLSQQELYIEANNLQPLLFVTSVFTDDPKSALKKIENACKGILRNREKYCLTGVEEIAQDSTYSHFIRERVSCLMKDLLKNSVVL